MIIDMSVYLIAFAISALSIHIFQNSRGTVRVKGITGKHGIIDEFLYCARGVLFLCPVIAMYGLRYGIGTDYITYERIYGLLHNTAVKDYLKLHGTGESFYYIEFGYYLLNRLFPSFRTMLWGIGIILFCLFLISIRDYQKNISFSFALFVFLTTQYIYSLNGMRFTIAFCMLLVAYIFLVQNRTKSFVLMVLAASLFHQSAVFCLAMFFLKHFDYKSVDSKRNALLFILILSFPLTSGYLLKIIGNTGLFERYFSVERYVASSGMFGRVTWTLHIVPVILPLIYFCRKEIFGSEDTKTLFRICIMEIPFRMLGLFNKWYTRFARYSQIGLVVFIPLVISKVQSRKKRNLLYAYYIAWFIFYFAYFAIIIDEGDSLPYVWVLKHTGKK